MDPACKSDDPNARPGERLLAVPLPQLVLLGVVAMTGLVAMRLIRLHLGRTPLPDGRGRQVFLVLFVLLPPIVFAALTMPADAGRFRGLVYVPIYVAILAALDVLMWTVAMVFRQFTHGRSGRLVRIGLIGNAGDPHDMPSNPPMTTTLAESVSIVDAANAAFPRGPAFPAQIARASFRDDWEALDGATRTLEGRISEDRGLGLGVAEVARVTAWDARTRLDALRALALGDGQAWAAG